MAKRTKPTAPPDAKAICLEVAKLRGISFSLPSKRRCRDYAVEELESGVDDTCEEWTEMTTAERESVMDARRWKSGDCAVSPSMMFLA